MVKIILKVSILFFSVLFADLKLEKISDGFEKPVYVGDVVRFYTSTLKTGKSSVSVQVIVIAERFDTNEQIEVTRAEMTMVSIDANGNTIPFESPPTAHTEGCS